MLGLRWKSKQKKQDEHFDAEDTRLQSMIDDLQKSREQAEDQADKTIDRYHRFVTNYSI